MALPTLSNDLNIVSKLDDQPNDVGGLTAAQLKAKFDEASGLIKTYINDTLLPYLEGTLGAGGIGITTVSGIQAATNVQDALAALEANIEGVTQGAVADNSINTAKLVDSSVTEAKLANGSVTTAKLADDAVTAAKLANNSVDTASIIDANVTEAKLASGAVTEAKIGAGAVTSAKIGAGAVTNSKLGNSSVVADNIAANAVTTAKILNGAVTNEKIAEGTLSSTRFADGSVLTAKIADGAVTDVKLANAKADLDSNSKVVASQASSSIVSVTANRTLALTDAGKFLYVNSTSDITITVPANASVAFPIGTEIEFCRYNTGAVTFAGASGVTIYSIDSVKTISDRYGCVALKKISTNAWILSGALG